MKIRSYVQEDTRHPHYKDQLVYDVWGLIPVYSENQTMQSAPSY